MASAWLTPWLSRAGTTASSLNTWGIPLPRQLLGGVLVHTQGQVGLGQQQVGLGLKEQITQVVGGVLPVLGLAAQGHVEADGEAGKIPGAVGVAQVDQLVEFQPQALGELQGIRQRHARFPAVLIVGVKVLVHPAGREGGGVALHLEDDIQEPAGLDGFVVGLRGLLGQLGADLGHLLEVLLSRLLIHGTGQLGIPLDEMAGPLHRQGHALIKIALFLVRSRLQVLLGLLPNTVGAQSQPFFGVGTDVALGVVLLVDLHHLADGIHLGTHRLADLVLQRAALPVGQDVPAELVNVLLPDLEFVLGTGGQSLKLPVHPGGPGLREDHAPPNAGGAVAHNALLRVDADLDLLQGGLQGQGALDTAGLALRSLVAPGNNTRLLNGGIAGLGDHVLFQHPNPLRAGQAGDAADQFHLH